MNIRLASGGAVGQPLFSTSTTQFHPLGTEARDRFGGRFRYVKAGALMVVGDVQQAPAQDTDHDQITCRATAVGATELLITTGSGGGALDLNEYAGGFAIVDVTPGLGYRYPIKRHAAISASTNGSLILDDDTPIQVALTASSKVTLCKNPYNGVIQEPATTLTGAVVGVAVYPVASGSYGWIQTKGVAAVLIGGTPGVGACVVCPGDTAGEVVVDPANAAVAVVGTMMVTGVDGHVMPVLINFP